MRSFIVWSLGLYEVSLNCLWFRLPLEDRFSNSLLTMIYLPIKSSLYNIEQNTNIKVTHDHMYDFTGIAKMNMAK